MRAPAGSTYGLRRGGAFLPRVGSGSLNSKWAYDLWVFGPLGSNSVDEQGGRDSSLLRGSGGPGSNLV